MSAVRINPDNGIIEEDTSVFGGALGYSWAPKENDDGRAERIDPDSGVLQEDNSVFHGALGFSWADKK